MAHYGLEFGYRDNPDTLRRGRIGRGYMGGNTRRYGEEMYHGYSRGTRGGYDRGYQGGGYGADYGRQRLTGMESNRRRGVYGSDYEPGERNRGPHGGYHGIGRNRGGGMNPGRYGGWS
jgi:hypothetical protein